MATARRQKDRARDQLATMVGEHRSGPRQPAKKKSSTANSPHGYSEVTGPTNGKHRNATREQAARTQRGWVASPSNGDWHRDERQRGLDQSASRRSTSMHGQQQGKRKHNLKKMGAETDARSSGGLTTTLQGGASSWYQGSEKKQNGREGPRLKDACNGETYEPH